MLMFFVETLDFQVIGNYRNVDPFFYNDLLKLLHIFKDSIMLTAEHRGTYFLYVICVP